jgi:hypothetical protein
MEYHNRIIQLILPDKKLIKINIAGDENELKELISEIAGINVSQIKGIKDLKGNYYTLSAAIKTEDIYYLKDNYFELILGKENINKSPIKNNIETNNIIFTNSPNVGNYIANYYINGVKKKNNNHDLSLSQSMSKMNYKENEINEINAYLKPLISKDKISKEQYNELINLVQGKLLDEFKLIFLGKSNNDNLVSTIKNYIKSKRKIKFRSSTPLIKSKLAKKMEINSPKLIDYNIKVQIYEKMKEYFNDEDLDIIRLSLKYENEKVINEIKQFEKDQILSKLILTFKKFIEQYKKRKSIFGNKINYLFSTRQLNFDIENEEIIHQNKKLFSRQSLEQNNYKNNMKHFENYRTFSNSSKRLKPHKENDKKVIKKNLKKMLKKNNQIIFEYFKKHNKIEYHSLENIYLQNNSDKVSIKLNEKCEKFLENELIKYVKNIGKNLSESEIKHLHKLLDENNNDIQFIFNQFQIQQNLFKLIEDIYMIIKKKDDDTSTEEFYQYDEITLLFLNDLSKIENNEKERLKIKFLIESKNEKILNIIKKYKENQNVFLFKDEIKNLLNKKHTITILERLENKTLSPKHNHNNNYYNKNSYLEEFINEIKEKIILTNDEIKLLENNYPNDEQLKKIINDYFQKKPSLSEFKITLHNYLNKRSNKKKKSIKIPKLKSDKLKVKNEDLSITPETIKKSKKELSCFLYNEENKILNKQKEIISLLFKEDCLDENTYSIINKKIEKDDKALIAAFEVYAVSQDHIEFIETLQIIAELDNSHKESFYILLNKSSFNSSQKDELENLFKDKNTELINALEKYENNFDKDLVYGTFNKLISLNNN